MSNSHMVSDETLCKAADNVQVQERAHFLCQRSRKRCEFLTFYSLSLTATWIVQQKAWKRGILHRDCSLNNSMIEDFDDGSRGLLLDWEFAVKITKQGEYDLGGTVSVHALTNFSCLTFSITGDSSLPFCQSTGTARDRILQVNSFICTQNYSRFLYH